MRSEGRGWQAGRKEAYDQTQYLLMEKIKQERESAELHMHSWATGLSKILGKGKDSSRAWGSPG